MRFKLTLRTGLCLAGILMAVAALGLPGGSDAQGDATGLRVMTYNIHHGQGNDECSDPTAAEGELPVVQCAVDLERTADVIRGQDADFVALQEVDRFWARSGAVDQPDELATMLDMEACFAANLDHEPDDHSAQNHQYGTLILSRFPILSCENTFLPTAEGWEQRGLLEARVDVPGIGEVALLDTHLQAGREGQQEEAARQRTEQANAVSARIKEIDVPVIFLGDFNANPSDPELSSIFDESTGLQDAWGLGGDGTDGNTIPVDATADPENRIDFIFVSSQFTVDSTEVLIDESTRMTSDHYPVVADLSFSGNGTPTAPQFATPVT